MTLYIPTEVLYLAVFGAGVVTGAASLLFVAILWAKRRGV